MLGVIHDNMAPLPDTGLSVRFWGVRGSYSTCGCEFNAFGGNTPCVEVRLGNRLFVIDAGTGFAQMGRRITDQIPLDIDLLLSHLHTDHIGGLMMSKHLLSNPERVVRTHCGCQGGESAESALRTLFGPPFFPATLDCVPARFEHTGFKAGTTLSFADGLTVRTTPLPHPGGATGYRFDHDGRAVCYLSDLEHSNKWPIRPLIDFTRDADLVIFDGMFCEGDYGCHTGWGHSTWAKGVELCRAAGATGLAVFHHNPCYDDARLQGMEDALQKEMPDAFFARERMSVHFPAKV